MTIASDTVLLVFVVLAAVLVVVLLLRRGLRRAEERQRQVLHARLLAEAQLEAATRATLLAMQRAARDSSRTRSPR